MLKCFILFIVCFNICETKSFDKLEGSSCIVGDYNGTCLNINKCLQMLQKLIDNETPEICSYDGKVPIVCCTECSFYHVENLSNAILEPRRGVLFKNGRKAWDKCLDYINENEYSCKHPTTKLFLEWQNDTKCHSVGILHISATGGTAAQQGELPHMALLGYGELLEIAQWLCGGSLISENFILTAAHCISTPSLGPVKFAALGILKRSDPPEMWQRYSIKRSLAHPDYHSPSKYHDIALLETASTKTNLTTTTGIAVFGLCVKFSWLVLPACLPVKTRDHPYAVAAGWGALGYSKELADVLQKVYLTKFTEEECKDIYQPRRLLSDGYNSTTQMCFGDHRNIRDTCEGDSGGPLFLENGCSFDVIGVTSFGVACGFKGNAGMYTRVKHYMSWIESIVWP